MKPGPGRQYRFDLALVLQGKKQEYTARGWTIALPDPKAREITLRDVTFGGDNLPPDPWGLGADREILAWTFPMSAILFWVLYGSKEE